MAQPLILITNDDGINFVGIKKLKEALAPLGEIWIVAPDAERSAVGHAITITTPLRVNEVYIDDSLFGYSVNGTPADCVKLAVSELLPRKPDIVVAGINPGENTAMNVLYSGTVSAATEGVIQGIPSVAVSVASFKYREYDVAQTFIRSLAAEVLEKGLPPGTLLNVNIPPLPKEKIKGVRMARHGKKRFIESFEKRQDLAGRTYYWLGGKRAASEDDNNHDDSLVWQGYIAVSPIHFDLTDEKTMTQLQKWSFINFADK
jgi:5'-nucleotidase